MIKKMTAADVVYEQLRDDIISGKYKPGEKLSEVQLAEAYGVSRDPVRKSISRLIQENLLISKPQYGTIVSEVSCKQAEDICDIRMVLETYAISIAVKNISEEVLDFFQKEVDRIDAIIELGDDEYVRNAVYELDGKLHHAIYDACDNSMIANIISSYQYIIKRIQISNWMWHNRKKGTFSEMKDIISALKRRDEKAAVESMRVHILNIKKAVDLKAEKKE